jgi:hypothetical protein
MSDSDSSLTRRTALKGLGGVTGAALAGGTGLAALTGGAAAQASFDLNITGTTISNDQGDVSYVGVDATKTIAWDGFDVPLRYVGFKHEITIEDSGSTDWHTLYEGVSGRLTDWSGDGDSDGWGGDGEYVDSHGGDKADYLKGTAKADIQWEIINDTGEAGSYPDFGYDGGGVQNPAQWAGRLSVDADGATEKRVVKWKTTLTFYTENDAGERVQVTDDDGVSELTATERFGVTVTNEDGTTDATTDGTASGQ